MIPKVEAYHIQSPGWSSGMIRPSGVPILVTRVLMGEAPGSNPGSGPSFFAFDFSAGNCYPRREIYRWKVAYNLFLPSLVRARRYDYESMWSVGLVAMIFHWLLCSRCSKPSLSSMTLTISVHSSMAPLPKSPHANIFDDCGGKTSNHPVSSPVASSLLTPQSS